MLHVGVAAAAEVAEESVITPPPPTTMRAASSAFTGLRTGNSLLGFGRTALIGR